MKLEKFITKTIHWIGSLQSLIIHTVLFSGSFLLYFLGIDFTKILLTLTTIVSLEAIYLSIFIQMSVNSQAQKIQTLQENVEDIQENVEDIQENVEELQEDDENENEIVNKI
jgi:uncharacterized pyridoxal phosphate-containing UPF0001 family protein